MKSIPRRIALGCSSAHRKSKKIGDLLSRGRRDGRAHPLATAAPARPEGPDRADAPSIRLRRGKPLHRSCPLERSIRNTNSRGFLWPVYPARRISWR